MKNKYLTLALLTATLHTSAQKARDTSYKKQRIARTDIEVLFGYYNQNGNHSAITGGAGTEKLQVYSPEFTITHRRDSAHTFTLNAGIDVISSASLDNIDFVVSSASKLSARGYMNPGYSYQPKGTRTRIGVNTGFSLESAYLSIPAGVSIDHTDRSGNREWNISLQTAFDDLRWGRLSVDYGHPVGLIYPFELRDTAWFTNYRRSSYNLDIAVYQVINRRMQLSLFPALVYQKGLLSTPYHRVFFNDTRSSERVERLPAERWKLPLAAQLNAFLGDRTIIRSYYRFYHDNFGITAHTIQLELPVKVSTSWQLAPLIRWYTQTAARWFQPFAQHDITETFYTSDYDLSKFDSYKTGLTIRYAPQQYIGRHLTFNAASLRYAWYKRSDGLSAHIITLLLEIKHDRSQSQLFGLKGTSGTN